MTTLFGLACFVAGLYAGKKRAKGLEWRKIGKDFCRDAGDLVSAPFRKGTESETHSADKNG